MNLIETSKGLINLDAIALVSPIHEETLTITFGESRELIFVGDEARCLWRYLMGEADSLNSNPESPVQDPRRGF